MTVTVARIDYEGGSEILGQATTLEETLDLIMADLPKVGDNDLIEYRLDNGLVFVSTNDEKNIDRVLARIFIQVP